VGTLSSTKKTSALNLLLLVLLWGACFASAMAVVYSSYASRKATQQLEILRRESSAMQVVSGQYLLEKSTWAAYSRIEKIAVNNLRMKMPDSEKTVLVYRR